MMHINAIIELTVSSSFQYYIIRMYNILDFMSAFNTFWDTNPIFTQTYDNYNNQKQ